jgi:hypothetical protein
MSHKMHDVGAAKQLVDTATRSKTGPGLRWLYTSGTTGTVGERLKGSRSSRGLRCSMLVAGAVLQLFRSRQKLVPEVLTFPPPK